MKMKKKLFAFIGFFAVIMAVKAQTVPLKNIERAPEQRMIPVSDGKQNSMVFRDALTYIRDTLGFGQPDSIYSDSTGIKLLYGAGVIPVQVDEDTDSTAAVIVGTKEIVFKAGLNVLITEDPANNTITISTVPPAEPIYYQAGDDISFVGAGTPEDPIYINNNAPENTEVESTSTVELEKVAGNTIRATVIYGSITPDHLDRTYLEEETQELEGGDGTISISGGNAVFVTLDNCDLQEDELYLNLQFNVDQLIGEISEPWVAINDTTTDYCLKITGDAIQLPVGGNSTRPALRQLGVLRFNSDTDKYEIWTGTRWETLKSVVSPNQTNGSYSEVNPVTIGQTSPGNYTLNVFGSAMRVPVGRSFERPLMTTTGLLRYNSGFKSLEYFNGSFWKKINTEFFDTYFGFAFDEERVCVCKDDLEATYVLDIHAKGAIHLNTIDRPASPSPGILTYNKLTNKLEGYDGTYWVEF